MIYIIRHGQTELNSRQVLQGRSDHPLNETGRHQAEKAAESLCRQGVVFRKVYSSPLIRAVETARILAPGVAVETDDRLLEMDYGPYEGMDLKHPAPEVMAFFRDFNGTPAPEGMEALSDVVARAASFMEDRKEEEGDVLISTHAIAMKGILEALTPDAGGRFWSTFIGNCAVYRTAQENGRFSVPEEVELL